MKSRGVAPIVTLLIVVIIAISSFVVVKNELPRKLQEIIEVIPQPTSTPTPETSPTPTQISTPTTKPTKTSTKQTSKPTPTATPSPKLSTATCTVNFLAGDNTQSVRLVYGAANYTTPNYVAGVQWDWDGDGKWDTDMSLNNGNINHTFPGSGTYNVKLRLQMSDGLFTNVCSKSITIPFGITVSFTGQVFRDENCNKLNEPNEVGVGGVTINFINEPEYTIYKTLTSDSNGYFNLTTTLVTGQSLNLMASAVAPPYYKISYNPPAASLNETQRTINKNLPIVPAENIGLCSI